MWRVAPVLLALLFALPLVPFSALAGPPFLTDDPEPVEYEHWEIYVASISQEEHGGVSTTAPHVEINYGIAPNFQLHMIAPMEYVKTSGLPSHYGYGDMELGFKWRFYNDEETKFMAGYLSSSRTSYWCGVKWTGAWWSSSVPSHLASERLGAVAHVRRRRLHDKSRPRGQKSLFFWMAGST